MRDIVYSAAEFQSVEMEIYCDTGFSEMPISNRNTAVF